MKKKVTTPIVLFLFLLFFALSATAQERRQYEKLTPQEALKKKAEFKKAHPQLFLKLSLRSSDPAMRQVPEDQMTASAPVPQASPEVMKAAAATEFFGNITADNSWDAGYPQNGIYSIKPTSPVTVTPVAVLNDSVKANCGGGILKDGVYHYLRWDWYYGYFWVDYMQYDIRTNKVTIIKEDCTKGKYDLWATETAYDHNSGQLYGCFARPNNLNSYELGILDFKTCTRTTIGALRRPYVAMGFSRNGDLYGVAVDGNLYKINRLNAGETLIGSTGVTVRTTGGQYYGQSGEIDANSDIFYWASINNLGQSNLYTVDLKSGATSLVGRFTHYQQVQDLIIPAEAAADDAPAALTDLKVNYPNGSLNGHVTFTLPVKTYAGNDLSGTYINYTIMANNKVLATGLGTAGEAIDEPLRVSPTGQYKFTVYTTLNGKVSPYSLVNQWIGQDTPKAPENVTLDLKNRLTAETRNVKITWDPVTEGVHGGYVGTPTYAVMRVKVTGTETTILADNLTTTSWSDVLPDSLVDRYYYFVYAENGSLLSDGGRSVDFLAGNPLEPPFFDTFSYYAMSNLYESFDDNGDGKTWRYGNTHGTMNSMECPPSDDPNLSNDDYLLTGPFHLKANTMYQLTVNYRVNNQLKTCKFSMSYGEGDDYRNYPHELFRNDSVTATHHDPINITFLSEKDQVVKFAFHDFSDGHQTSLLLNDFYLRAGAVGAAPDSVTNLKAQAGSKGKLSAQIFFNCPTKSVDGKELTSLSKIEIYRSRTKLLRTYENPVPGRRMGFADNDTLLARGSYKYTVVAYNAEGGHGLESDVTVYIGPDSPALPANAVAKDNVNSIGISWDAVTKGVSGGYVDPEGVNYTVIDKFGNILVENTKDTSYEVEQYTDENEQDVAYYYITVANRYGNRQTRTNSIVVGLPFDLPYKESFANGISDNGFYWSEGANTENLALISNVAYDKDNGCLSWSSPTKGDAVSFNTGKIDLSTARNATLTFNYLTISGDRFKIQVEALLPDGTVKALKVFDPTSTGDKSGWHTGLVDLNAVKDNRYVVLKFHMFNEGYAEGDVLSIALDNIQVVDLKQNDLQITLETPTRVKAGTEATLKATVLSMGSEAAKDYTVNFYAGDELIKSLTGDTLQTVESKDYAIDYTVKINTGDKQPVRAEVVYGADEDTGNNVATGSFDVYQPDFPVVSDLTAKSGGGAVKLNWTAPATVAAIPVTEDFESYAPWSVNDIGDWKLFNLDGGLPVTINGAPNYPHMSETYAYIVMNPLVWGYELEANPSMSPYSGNQFLATFARTKVTGAQKDYITSVANDDWLVSPLLSGKAQTISLKAAELTSDFGPEKIEILYSTTGRAAGDFISLKTVNITKVPQGIGRNYQDVLADLPEGAKYFAVRCVSEDVFMLMIDDISYTAAGASEITGYNIYRDGQLVAHVDGAGTGYTDKGGSTGAHTYNVTVVYGVGESSFSNDASTATDISEIVPDAQGEYNVYTVDGRAVSLHARDIRALKTGVYIINGQKVTVKN